MAICFHVAVLRGFVRIHLLFCLHSPLIVSIHRISNSICMSMTLTFMCWSQMFLPSSMWMSYQYFKFSIYKSGNISISKLISPLLFSISVLCNMIRGHPWHFFLPQLYYWIHHTLLAILPLKYIYPKCVLTSIFIVVSSHASPVLCNSALSGYSVSVHYLQQKEWICHCPA